MDGGEGEKKGTVRDRSERLQNFNSNELLFLNFRRVVSSFNDVTHMLTLHSPMHRYCQVLSDTYPTSTHVIRDILLTSRLNNLTREESNSGMTR